MLVALAVGAAAQAPEWVLTLLHGLVGIRVDRLTPLYPVASLLSLTWWPAVIGAVMCAVFAQRGNALRTPAERRWATFVIGATVAIVTFEATMWISWQTGAAWINAMGADPPVWIMVSYSVRPALIAVVLLAPLLALFPVASSVGPRWAVVIWLAMLCLVGVAARDVVTMIWWFISPDVAIFDRMTPLVHLILYTGLRALYGVLTVAMVIALLPGVVRRERAIRCAMTAATGAPAHRVPVAGGGD